MHCNWHYITYFNTIDENNTKFPMTFSMTYCFLLPFYDTIKFHNLSITLIFHDFSMTMGTLHLIKLIVTEIVKTIPFPSIKLIKLIKLI